MAYGSIQIEGIDSSTTKTASRITRPSSGEEWRRWNLYFGCSSIQIRNIDSNKGRQKQSRELRKLFLEKKGEDDGYSWRIGLYRSETWILMKED